MTPGITLTMLDAILRHHAEPFRTPGPNDRTWKRLLNAGLVATDPDDGSVAHVTPEGLDAADGILDRAWRTMGGWEKLAPHLRRDIRRMRAGTVA